MSLRHTLPALVLALSSTAPVLAQAPFPGQLPGTDIGQGLPAAFEGNGTTPGFQAPSFLLPLNSDAYLQLTASHANVPPFVSTLGAFDASGASLAALAVPPLPPGLVGLTLHHAYLTFHPVTTKIVAASNAEFLAIVP